MRFIKNTYLFLFLVTTVVTFLQFFNLYSNTDIRSHYNSQVIKETIEDVMKIRYENVTDYNIIFNNINISVVPENFSDMKTFSLANINSYFSFSCRGNIFLYIIIFSDKWSFKQRQKIRQSWASIKIIDNKLISYVFLVTFSPNKNNVDDWLVEETKKYNDIFYSNYTSSWNNRTYLYLDALKLSKSCQSSQFALMIKEDSFPNIPAIIKELSSNVSLMCNVVKNNIVIRDKKNEYYVPEYVYEPQVYPSHCKNDSPIIISNSLATTIVNNFTTPKMWFYDAYLFGILPDEYNATLTAFPKSISIMEMRPHFAYLSRKAYGILVNGMLLNEKIWKKLMVQIALQ